ncbi:MAG: aspartyl/asparaginyl beta-hydroxylase domain-containing protein [Xanthomonadales bacterium]|nr:aspartyl/asparaginyl beta-hydroxylase domain-containing protein [Xanthomonadales bacterium]
MTQAVTIDSLRRLARAAQARSEPAEAARIFSQLLELSANDAEALQCVAGQCLARGDSARGIELLTQATNIVADDAELWRRLGEARMQGGDFVQAAEALRKALALQPDACVARLQLGAVLEQLGHSQDALVAYYGAIRAAQFRGQWTSAASTPPAMRHAVHYAMGYVDRGRKQLLDAVLEPLRQSHGAAALERVEHCVAVHVHAREAVFPDPRQRPKFLYFPDLPSRPFYDQNRFPEHRKLESATTLVREELQAVLQQTQSTLEPFFGQERDVSRLLQASGSRSASWDAFFFHRYGQREQDNCRQCPQTSALLDASPLVGIRDHAPEILFSVLRPGTRIMPHRGVTNVRLVTHLPLIVPPDCALQVGGEPFVWEEGRCVTFDDTYEHEAWNHSDQTRVVLIMDSWNPDLTLVEREAIGDVIAAIGDFNGMADVAGMA